MGFSHPPPTDSWLKNKISVGRAPSARPVPSSGTFPLRRMEADETGSHSASTQCSSTQRSRVSLILTPGQSVFSFKVSFEQMVQPLVGSGGPAALAHREPMAPHPPRLSPADSPPDAATERIVHAAPLQPPRSRHDGYLHELWALQTR